MWRKRFQQLAAAVDEELQQQPATADADVDMAPPGQPQPGVGLEAVAQPPEMMEPVLLIKSVTADKITLQYRNISSVKVRRYLTQLHMMYRTAQADWCKMLLSDPKISWSK